MAAAPLLPRRTAAALLLPLLTLALSGCGFHLRVPESLPFERIALSGFAPHSTMADEIRRALPPEARITPNVLEAQVVVEAVEDTRETTVEASTASGQVRELRLHVKLRYRVLKPGGVELLRLNELERERDLTYNESNALAKDTELNALYRDMQSDIATQLVRILAAVGRAN